MMVKLSFHQNCVEDNELISENNNFKECQSKSDCKDIGNLNEGKYVAQSCDDGICKYDQFAASRATRMRIFF